MGAIRYDGGLSAAFTLLVNGGKGEFPGTNRARTSTIILVLSY